MACERCDPSCKQCLSCHDDYLLLPQGGRCLKTCSENFYHDRAKTCRRCHPTCKTCGDQGALACTSCYHGYRQFAGICESDCSLGSYTPSESSSHEGSSSLASDVDCVPCDSSCLDCRGPSRWNCTVCPALQILADDGRCLSCCGETAHNAPLPHECCVFIIHTMHADTRALLSPSLLYRLTGSLHRLVTQAGYTGWLHRLVTQARYTG